MVQVREGSPTLTLQQAYPELWHLVMDNIGGHRDRCDKLATINRNWYRRTGVILITLTVSLPVLAILSFPYKVATLTASSLVIALITGLRSFYRWEEKWALFRVQQFTLAYLIVEWEMDLLQLVNRKDRDGALEEAQRKTVELIERTRDAMKYEMHAFFNTTGSPEFR
jgi:hypothetical protein